MTTENCIFCKIISGEIPAKIVDESTHAIAFEDIAPAQPVHVLVVPKVHYANVVELASQASNELVDLVRLGCKVAESLTEGAFRFTFNTGAEAGQTVFHAHGHVLSKVPKN